MMIKKYKEKPKTVEAQQWVPGKSVWGLVEHGSNGDIYGTLETQDGITHVSPGDFIVKDADGCLCVVRPEVFAETYEVLDTVEESISRPGILLG